jgi:inositol transporter-like SP family MFS transporter
VIFALASTYAVALFGASLGLGFMAATFSFTKLVAAEQYPTRLRGSGTTFAEAVGRGIAGVLVPFFIGDLIVNRGIPVACALVFGLGVIGIVLYVAFARETRGATLEELEEAAVVQDGAIATAAEGGLRTS